MASDTLAEILERRSDPMLAVRECSWLADLADVPENASLPLAMSPPHPRAVGSYGADWVEWMRSTQKVEPRWWQKLAATRQLEHDADGVLVYREVVESGPRRIGKSVRLRGTALWRVAHADLWGEDQLAMLVSKDLAVGKEIHRGAWNWCKKNDWEVLKLGGAQEVETPDGTGRWLLRAPNAAYGYDVGYGQVDESWGVDPQAITDGLEPALLERKSPQLHMTSTAHVKASSLMRRRLLAALRDADPDVLLLLWGAPPGSDYADEAAWRLASPHWSNDRRDLMARKYAAALAGQDEPEFDDPDPVRGWAAQYLNVWPLLEAGNQGIFGNWDSLTGTPAEPTALAISCDLERRWLVLGGSDGRYVGLVTPAALGQARVPVARQDEFLDEVARISFGRDLAVTLQKNGPAWHLRDGLADRGVRLNELDFTEVVAAGAALDRRVEAAEVAHGDDSDLNTAVRDATWRTVSGRKVLDDRHGALAAVSLAHYGATKPPPAPRIYSWADPEED